MRRTELDLCRISGCLMVLVIHAGAEIYQRLSLDSSAFAQVNLISSAVRGSVPLFFMLSGALMLSRPELDIKKLLRNHALKLMLLFFAWSFAYAFLGRLVSGDFGTAKDFIGSVVQGHYHLWFIPTMVMCYTYMPIAHSAIHGTKLDKNYLPGVFFVMIMLLANMNLTPAPAPVLYSFTLHFKLDFLAYMGYVVWGWWLSEKEMPRHTLWAAPLIFLAVTLLSSWGNHWYSFYKGEADGWFFSYFSLPTFIQATSLFCFFLSLKGRKFRCTGLITALSDCTLGVYFIHPMMINLLERFGIAVRKATATRDLLLLLAVLSISCFAIVYVAKRIPLIKKLF